MLIDDLKAARDLLALELASLRIFTNGLRMELLKTALNSDVPAATGGPQFDEDGRSLGACLCCGGTGEDPIDLRVGQDFKPLPGAGIAFASAIVG